MKTFEIEKKFAKKWIEALRGGEYKQVIGSLYKDNGESLGYCCLGVACALVGITTEEMIFHETPYDLLREKPKTDFKDMSKALLEQSNDTKLVDVVMCLNDGITKKELTKFKAAHPNLIFDKKVSKYEAFTFEDIATFIETNCKFI
jgi:hypothetical protein